MKNKEQFLRVNEIFYSIQGEGFRSGEASIFIRLSGCNLNCNFCDTNHSFQRILNLEEIYNEIAQYPCKWIVWTGGEPLMQLNDEVLECFQSKGYKQALETNGTVHYDGDFSFDYVCVSPKQRYFTIPAHKSTNLEIRYPVAVGDKIKYPEIRYSAYFYLSPIFTADPEETQKNIDYCVSMVKQDPRWRLSVQTQKICNFL